MNIAVSAPLASSQSARSLVRIVIVGHVDHGKSTLIGRLLHETGSLPDGKLENLKAVSARRGIEFEWSFLLDALQTERDQGITIDTSQIRFRTPSRDIVLIDAPGHTEFLRNMITGAAQADAAILIVDAAEGVRDQTRRHGYLLHLLGVRQVAVVINKMDRVDYSAARFQEIRDEIAALGLKPVAVIPISARSGDGVARRTTSMAWHDGPTVLEALDSFEPARPLDELPLRLPVQAVYRMDYRIIAGRIESGELSVGDEIVVMPAGKVAQVKSIEAWPAPQGLPPVQCAGAGQSIGITIDRELFIDRGDLITTASAAPETGRKLRARVFWLHPTALSIGARVKVRSGTAETVGVIRAINNAIDPANLKIVSHDTLAPNHVGDVEIALARPIAADPHAVNPAIGRIVIDYADRIAGGGLVLGLNSIEQERPSAPALQADATRLAQAYAPLSPADRLVKLRQDIKGKVVFTTSFGLEDQIITHLLWKQNIDVELITLDTGRLFNETYALWAETERRYGRRIRALYPSRRNLEALIATQGANGFYESKSARLACCQVRKIEPLERALADVDAWITGLRGEQSAFRKDMALVSADQGRGLIKVNPLFDQTREQILALVSEDDIPINPLHGKGFASIGCAPCTRAISPGEPERAGRWWWEDESNQECGLHMRRE
ncbi:MAG TPA: phosphoadenylyl-sulfate reductase [Xanthobacteraceae bacterium]|nr:phosphoadenylyl-sulfate reductase [Xanthobacteraceae bacterium]